MTYRVETMSYISINALKWSAFIVTKLVDSSFSIHLTFQCVYSEHTLMCSNCVDYSWIALLSHFYFILNHAQHITTAASRDWDWPNKRNFFVFLCSESLAGNSFIMKIVVFCSVFCFRFCFISFLIFLQWVAELPCKIKVDICHVLLQMKFIKCKYAVSNCNVM